MGREIKIDRDRATMDDMFKELQQIAHTMPKKYMSQVQSSSNMHTNAKPTREVTPENQMRTSQERRPADEMPLRARSTTPTRTCPDPSHLEESDYRKNPIMNDTGFSQKL